MVAVAVVDLLRRINSINNDNSINAEVVIIMVDINTNEE